ncbi:uncharacterized protein LOC143008685 isoform X2 [Genypterus blacodes]|uniref:uncharacterized protein LOC143008685 isoform X2 n=1 Tax=Genypterus blacodes TaxID=154954 RepID=UPI003F76C7FF
MSPTRVQSSVSARMVSIRTSKSSMEVAQKEKDAYRFLQMFSQVHQDMEKAKAADLRIGLEPGGDWDKLVEEIRHSGEKMLEQAAKFCGSLMTMIDPENHLKDPDKQPSLTFDPLTLGTDMSLSKDKKKVFSSPDFIWELSAHTLQIQGLSPESKIQSWMFSLSKECDWIIGLCDKQAARELTGYVYGLCCRDNQLNALMKQRQESNSVRRRGNNPSNYQQPITLQDGKEMTRPQKVEVEWNPPARSLSFFNRSSQHERIKIHTVTVDDCSEELIPFVRLGKENASPVGYRRNFGFHEQTEQYWQCPCGTDHYLDDENQDSDEGGYSSPNRRCSCGRLVGDPFTEVVCELL